MFDALRPRKRTPEKVDAAASAASARKAIREATVATGTGLSNDVTSNINESDSDGSSSK